MLQALRANPARQANFGSFPLLAPVGGLNGVDALSAMPPTDAVTLENLFPQASYCQLRNGFAEHVTGCGGSATSVETLMTYFALDGSEKLFAVANNVIYDATATGSATSSYSASITSSKWQWINFSNTGGTFLLAYNGQDAPLKYNGSAWSTNLLTGSIPSSARSVISAFQFNERVFLCQKNSLNLWYLASQAISGTATKLPLGGVFNKGGGLVGGGSFSFDAGASVDDYLVAITNNGEAAVYAGTNPATDFVLKGVFDIGVPIGNRPIVKVGGDLIIVTTKGAVPMSAMMSNDRAKAEQVAVTAKIQTLFNTATQNYGSNFGWQALNYPAGAYMLVNVPQVQNTTAYQYVQNVITGSWCTFTNMNANCWGLLNDGLYFGGNDGTVYHADYGLQDNGSQITWDVKTAFNYCGSNRNKYFKALQPFLVTSGTASFLGGVNVDYDDVPPTGTINATAGSVGVWGVTNWDASNWGGVGILVRPWLTVGRFGTVVAGRFLGGASNITVQLNGFNVVYETMKGTFY